MMKTSTVNFLNKHDHIELFGDAFFEIQPRSLHAPLYLLNIAGHTLNRVHVKLISGEGGVRGENWKGKIRPLPADEMCPLVLA